MEDYLVVSHLFLLCASMNFSPAAWPRCILMRGYGAEAGTKHL